MAHALVYEAFQANSSVLCRSNLDLARDFLKAEAFGQHDRAQHKYLNPISAVEAGGEAGLGQ